MNFPSALTIVLSGGVVSRSTWSGSGFTIGVLAPPADSKIMPFLAIMETGGNMMAWVPNQQEMFATDWVRVEEVSGHG